MPEAQMLNQLAATTFPYSGGTIAWPLNTSGTWIQPAVQWQTTSSNATYASAAAVLK